MPFSVCVQMELISMRTERRPFPDKMFFTKEEYASQVF